MAASVTASLRNFLVIRAPAAAAARGTAPWRAFRLHVPAASSGGVMDAVRGRPDIKSYEDLHR